MSQTFIYRLKLNERYHSNEGWTEDTYAVFSRHAAYLDEAAAAGKALLVGRTDVAMKDNFGIVIFHADDEKAAKEFMMKDPCVTEKIMSAEVFPFRVAFGNPSSLEAELSQD